ncbi:MAG: pre-16S rRNA-processing nuclease YqgF [Cyanobacteria bacterium P01_H01_bin.121]
MAEKSFVVANPPQAVTLGFDPGRDKCGVAAVDQSGQILERHVLAVDEVIEQLHCFLARYPINCLVMGNQTTSGQWQERLQQAMPDNCPIVLVDERHSSLEARDRYWELHPPQGLQRLIPKGLRQPPVPIDDIVAVLLVERYRTPFPPSS